MSEMNRNRQRRISLFKGEIEYLMEANVLSKDLVRLVATAEIIADEKRVLKLDADVAERFRDEFTTRLAQVGLDSNYEPTREGKLLEDLIDRFSEA